jgi:hypothetical protein
MSRAGEYRYSLVRTFHRGPTATFIMLNPSTADARVDDPTIRKCMSFCRRWDCGTLQVVNLFGIRATSPRDMMSADDPIGSGNRRAVAMAIHAHQGASDVPLGPVVCAWGAHGRFLGQDRATLQRLRRHSWLEPMCLGVTKAGHPRHPLYVRLDTRLVPYLWGDLIE